ncbi:hypothetical protein DB88DRAFT_206087 [Papiliotrema laurentii]|uniref:Uncharacterized protein n=1 Tax=Papiliotrema laurentii TaxID=5418 RepID=A0AAD9FT00_PAPLA|nr:hypothetical protein DB88DRAFT_206087 [Papiliotrema laurentii]
MAPPIGPSDLKECINLARSRCIWSGKPPALTNGPGASQLLNNRVIRRGTAKTKACAERFPDFAMHSDSWPRKPPPLLALPYRPAPIKGSQTLSDTPGSSCNPFTSGLSATGPSFLPSGGNGVANDSVAGTEWRSGSRSYAGKVAAQKDSGLADRHGPPSSMSYAAALTVTHPAVDLGATPTSPSSRSEVEQTALASSPDGGLPVLQHSHQAHDPNSQNALAIKSYAVALTVSGAAEVKPFGDGVKTHDKKDEPPSGVKDGWSSTCKVTFRRKTAFSS